MPKSIDTTFLAPLIYPPQVPTRDVMEKEAENGLQANQSNYQWELDDNYPPHVKTVPEGDKRSTVQIFDVQALLQAKGMVAQDGEISNNYRRLAPDPNVNTLDALIEHNQAQRAPPGVENNMLFRFNIGDRRQKDWYSDAVFAQQHFTGTNATTITLAKEWTAAFQEVADATKNTKMSDLLRSALASSLYVQDYSYFRPAMGLPNNAIIQSGDGRYSAAPVALFQLSENGHLHPLAIVIDYKGSMSESVVIFNERLAPAADLAGEKNDWPWRYAKTCVQSADWLRHEVAIHLVNTHLVEEATIVAANRTLPPHHVVFQLLKKHWETTLSLNSAARESLVPNIIDKLAGVGKTEMDNFLNHAYSSFDWSRLRIPKDLESRGFPLADLEKSPKFHNYAYARNMALMWPVIRSFVDRILRPCYSGGDEHVAADSYIQNFCSEMRSSKGANMSSFPEIKTLDELIDIVTMCIHIASPQHTAVNYLQHYYQVFVPNKPWALYAPLPCSLSELQGYKERHLLDALPFKITTDWLIGTQLPYLLSFEVAGESNLLTYVENESKNSIELIAESARTFREDLEMLREVFRAHSKELDDQDTRYMVMDPSITAVSILI